MTLPLLHFSLSSPPATTHFMHSFSLQAHISVEGLAVVKHVVFLSTSALMGLAMGRKYTTIYISLPFVSLSGIFIFMRSRAGG